MRPEAIETILNSTDSNHLQTQAALSQAIYELSIRKLQGVDTGSTKKRLRQRISVKR